MFTAFFAQTFNNAFVYLDYYTNTVKYAEHCENKDKPTMHCNGKCQMNKKIQQEEKKDQENPERRADNKNEIVVYSNAEFACVSNILLLRLQNNYRNFNSSFISSNCRIGVFHPPQILFS